MAKDNKGSTKGFTLLEVLLALAIAGIALISLQKAQTGQVNIFDRVRYSDLGHWVAANKMTEYQILDFWPTENKLIRIQTDFGGATWQVDSNFEDTLDPQIKRVDVSVRLLNSRYEHAKMTGFIRNKRPQALTN